MTFRLGYCIHAGHSFGVEYLSCVDKTVLQIREVYSKQSMKSIGKKHSHKTFSATDVYRCTMLTLTADHTNVLQTLIADLVALPYQMQPTI